MIKVLAGLVVSAILVIYVFVSDYFKKQYRQQYSLLCRRLVRELPREVRLEVIEKLDKDIRKWLDVSGPFAVYFDKHGPLVIDVQSGRYVIILSDDFELIRVDKKI
ncbi:MULTISPECIES: hypothetical protein [Leuconostoc]|uniref:hypothetical protein n=1 Tax=Leuconostoc TaxID=1243 RepID=UPI0021A78476|nr:MULTISPECIES: hypothetical protein [Leuconostoc]MCT4413371.1 hypothetical protein [Leuconostoc pseudomesenteroides]MDN2451548.1 hypothetical protein [Leuconostoc sp. UCMA20149]